MSDMSIPGARLVILCHDDEPLGNGRRLTDQVYDENQRKAKRAYNLRKRAKGRAEDFRVRVEDGKFYCTACGKQYISYRGTASHYGWRHAR